MNRNEKPSSLISLIAHAPNHEALAACLEQAIKIVRAGSGATSSTTRYASGAEFTLEATGGCAEPSKKKGGKGGYKEAVPKGGWAAFWAAHGGETWGAAALAQVMGCTLGAAKIAMSSAITKNLVERREGGACYVFPQSKVRS